MDIVTIVILAVAVLIVFVLFAIVVHGKKDKAKATKTEAKKEDPKPTKEELKEESKPEDDETMQILEEVTRGNYMKDRAEQNLQNHEFSIDDIKETNDDIRPVRRMQPIAYMDDDDGALDTDSILSEIDGDQPSAPSISREFSKLSKEMKAIIISNAMKRKDE